MHSSLRPLLAFSRPRLDLHLETVEFNKLPGLTRELQQEAGPRTARLTLPTRPASKARGQESARAGFPRLYHPRDGAGTSACVS